VTVIVGWNGSSFFKRVELLHHGGDVVDRFPDNRIVAFAEALHLVTDAPKEDRRMILVAQHGLAGRFELLAHLGLVAVVEPVAFVAQPNAYRHRQAEGVRRVETRVDVICAPCPHRVRARRRQLLERTIPAGATDEIRLTAAQQLPAPLCLAEFHRDGLRRRDRGPERQAGG
jgi:hypothetical protein